MSSSRYPGHDQPETVEHRSEAPADDPQHALALLHGRAQLIEEFRGNVKDVAAFLNEDRNQVYRWLRREQIDLGLYRRESR